MTGVLRSLNYFNNLILFLCLWLSFIASASAEQLRIAFGSCISEVRSPIWDAISAKKPDLVLMLGDNIYQKSPDFGDLKKIQSKYKDLFGGILKLRSISKVFAVWDDHDYGPNNSDRSFKGRAASLKAFQEFWTDNPKAALENSIAFEHQIGRVLILALDNRSFRDLSPDRIEHRAIFGRAQLDWIEARLGNTTASLVLIASGGQILSERPGTETLSYFPLEQQRLFKIFAHAKSKIIIISGDIHHAEILERKMPNQRLISEITSSPLSSSHAPLHERGSKDPYRIAAYAGQDNFGVLDIKLDNKVDIHAMINDRWGKTLLNYYPELGQPIL